MNQATETLHGRVFAADGKPAAGAIVWAAKNTLGPLEWKETTADANGRYALDLTAGAWYLSARKGTQGGEGPARRERIEIIIGLPPEPVLIRLEERGTFRGRLLEAETGKPIVGGKLYLDTGLILTTDDAGRFETGGLYRSNHEAFVVAAGHVRMRVLFDTTAKADTELEVPVPRSGKIVGRVTDTQGNPIHGAYVGRVTSGSHCSLNALFENCDKTGRFEYDDAAPPDQPTRLAAFAPGYVADERHGIVVPAGGKLELLFRLRPNAIDQPNVAADVKRRTISGIVRDPENKPVAGVLVRWGYRPTVDAIQTRTDAGGRFRLTTPDDAGMISVLPRRFLPEFPKVAAGNQNVEVKLRPGFSARGVVVGDGGKPIKDVVVIAMIGSPDPRLGGPFWLLEAMARTDGDGRFEVRGVPEHARFDFLRAGLSDLRNQQLMLGGTDNKVTMQYDGAVYGRVVDRDGKPIRNFRILVAFPQQRLPGDKTEGYFAGYSGMGVRFTSNDGTFVVTGVGAGAVYRIRALAPGHGEAVAERLIAIPVNRLATAKPELLKASPPVAFRVRAVTTDGKPVTDARVTLIDGQTRLDESFSWGYDDASWENMVRARTNADGWAEFTSLSFNGATVLVQAPGFGRQRIGWRDQAKELRVTLQPEASVVGVVRDAAGVPLKEFGVVANGMGNRIVASPPITAKGRFRLAELPPGNWTITVYGSDYLTVLHSAQITLSSGETKELAIDLK